MIKTYDIFEGKYLEVAELIQQRRLQILVHSCIYYELNRNKITDAKWDSWAKELVQLQAQYPDIAKGVRYAEAFAGFDGSTGFDLPLKDEWVMRKALQLCGGVGKKEVKKQKPKGGRLF